MAARWVMRGLKMAVMVVAGILVFGFAVMLLWNALIPEIFNGPAITFWQAIGLLVLSHLLLRGGGRFGNGWRRDRWRHRFEKKLAAMAPEEREKFREEWRRRCGWTPGEGNEKQS